MTKRIKSFMNTVRFFVDGFKFLIWYYFKSNKD